MADSIEDLRSRLREQGAAPSQLTRIAQLRALFETASPCVAAALVGSFAKGTGGRWSDLDLIAFTATGQAQSFADEADHVLSSEAVLDSYHVRDASSCVLKYVYLDFTSCELLVLDVDRPSRLFRPYIALWDPSGFLAGREVEGQSPQHEAFEPYPHGDAGMIWELVDCIKWIKQGRVGLAKGYLRRLGAKLQLPD